MSATPCDENAGEHSPVTIAGEDNVYDYVEWKASTENESAAQREDIELSTNAAYGRVQR